MKRNQPATRIKTLPQQELQAIVAKATGLSEEERQKLIQVIETLATLTAALEQKNASIVRLRRLLFGVETEKYERLLSKHKQTAATGSAEGEGANSGRDAVAQGSEAKPRRGHGKNGTFAYPGAKRIRVPHPEHKSGDSCPRCRQGKLYPYREQRELIRIEGVAPLSATIYECERYRCNHCHELYNTPAPAGIGEDKYDESATALVAQLKYGAGLPFHRIEKLQKGMGIPMPAATQWELVRDGAKQIVLVYEELIRQAAQGEVLHNDDTTMQILQLTPKARAQAATDKQTEGRKGVFTSGIVSLGEGKKIALFFTGAKHAGENIQTILKQRAEALGPPIQMCDALSRNTSGELKTIVANCLAHARRKFVEVIDDFPEECGYVLSILRDVYKHEAETRGLSAEARLLYHQTHSQPRLAELRTWLDQQFADQLVEPNSNLGEAIKYMQKHWDKLTLFLREPGAPLDNNIVERALKKAILHRKNALFYKTETGAQTGDLYMSLIYTAELNHVPPFEYLKALFKHHRELARAPAAWLPWTYQATLAQQRAAKDPTVSKHPP